MKFRTTELTDAAKTIGMFVPAKSPIPSAECVYIEAQEDGYVWVRSADPFGAAAALMIHADVEKAGNAFVLAKHLNAVLGRMNNDVEVDAEGKVCTITSGDTEVSLMLWTDDYTKPQHIDGKPVVISAERFAEIINGVTFAAAGDTSVHSGVKFEVYASVMTAVCLDGFRMAVRSTAVDGDECEFVLPSRLLTEVAKICSGDVHIYHSAKAVRIETNGLNITIPQLKGDFMQWKNALPNGEKTIVKGAKNDFLKKIELLNAVNDQKKPVVLKFADNICEFSIQTSTSAIKDRIGVDMTGDDVTIAFNQKFIYDAIKNADEEIELRLNGSLAAATVRGGSFCYLILPVKVRE